MPLFSKINESIYFLELTSAEAPIVLVRGKNNFLINCGSCDKSVDYGLLPALKKLGQSLKSIHGVVFTDCSDRAAGGAHRLRELLPGAKFLAFDKQDDRLRNPTYHESVLFSVCPDYAPPVGETRGIFIDGYVNTDTRMFEELEPVPFPGHGDDSICWYHKNTKTMICGENIQGDGTSRTGIAFITDKTKYEGSLEILEGYDIETLVCAPDIKELDAITHGKAQCLDVVNRSIAISKGYEKFVREFINSRRAQQLTATLEELTSAYFAYRGFKPHYQGYAMLTLHGYIG